MNLSRTHLPGAVNWTTAFRYAFLFFVLTGFVLLPSPVWAFPFYTVVIPLGAVAIWQHRADDALRSVPVLLVLALILWFALTLIWGIDQTPRRIAKYANAWLSNSLFVSAGVLFLEKSGESWRERLFGLLPVAAALNAALSIVGFFSQSGPHPAVRLNGFAETRHPILGADVMAVVGVIALRNCLVHTDRRVRMFDGACLGLICCFVVLTESRGPMAALFCALAIMTVSARPRRTWSKAILPLLVLIGVGLAVPAVREHVADVLFRSNHRLEIWQAAWGYIQARPWFGHGVANVNSFADWTFPHSLYISALYYGGIVGLLLLVAMFAVLIGQAAAVPDGTRRGFLLALLSVPLVAGLTDLGQPIKPPAEEWYILWLPVVIAIALTTKRDEATLSLS